MAKNEAIFIGAFFFVIGAFSKMNCCPKCILLLFSSAKFTCYTFTKEKSSFFILHIFKLYQGHFLKLGWVGIEWFSIPNTKIASFDFDQLKLLAFLFQILQIFSACRVSFFFLKIIHSGECVHDLFFISQRITTDVI